jgi:hypothetical protein
MSIANADELNGVGDAHIHRFTFNSTGCKEIANLDILNLLPRTHKYKYNCTKNKCQRDKTSIAL